MNDNYIKEYEEMSLCDFADELVEPLCTIKKDLTKTIYIHYAKERDKNDELVQENARLKDKIGKLKFAIESNCIKDGKKYQEICCDGDYLLEILKEN